MAQPVRLAKGSRFILLASVCVVVAALHLAREVLIPLALATLLTFLLAPVVRRLEKLRLGRVASTLIVVLSGLAVVVGIGWVVERQFEQIAGMLPDYGPQIHDKIDRLTHTRGGFGEAISKIEETAKQVAPATSPSSQPSTQPGTQPATAGRGAADLLPAPQLPQDTPGQPALPNVSPKNPLPVRLYPESPSAVRQVLSYVGVALDPLATAGIVVVFVIFMLIKREDLRDRLIRLTGQGRLQLTTAAMDDAAARISRYLLSQAIINTCFGILITLGLFLAGKLFGHGQSFPSVLLWGLMAGLFRFIPYIGPLFGAAGPLVVAFGFFPGNGVFFAVIGMFLVVELLVSQVAEPLVYGSSTGMSTLAVLVAAVFWTWLWGPVGLLLSTPVTAVLVVLGRYVPQLQFLDVILGDEPVLEPPVRVYQRLLAFDQEEATELARAYLKERGSLLPVYDDILLPALALAEHDRHHDQLDDDRYAFIHRAMRGVVDELWDLRRQAAEAKAAAGAAAPADKDTSPPPSDETSLDAAIPKDCKITVLCLPARGEGDDVANLMLVQLLEERGYCASLLAQTALASEMVEAVGTRGAHAVVVSALPPSAVSHARYLCKRLHAAHGDDLNMVVGLWTVEGDLSGAKERIACAGTVRMTATFRQALTELHQIVQGAIVTAKS